MKTPRFEGSGFTPGPDMSMFDCLGTTAGCGGGSGWGSMELDAEAHLANIEFNVWLSGQRFIGNEAKYQIREEYKANAAFRSTANRLLASGRTLYHCGNAVGCGPM